jgi:UDP-N-acetylmuramyl pentapeptide synthase
MRYGLPDLIAMLPTAAGRLQLRNGGIYRWLPVLSRIAFAYRRTLARNTRVTAIVGSLGKSTTTQTVATLLGAPMHAAMLRNSWSSAAVALLRIRPGQRHAVVELGIAGPGEMRPYSRMVRPDIVVVTSIASEHHRSLGSLDVTRDEKAWMVRALAPSGTAVLNGDDPNVTWMKGETKARIVTFGFSSTSDVRAENFQLDWPHGSRFTVHSFGQRREVEVRLVGRHMVYPALAAIAVAHVEGVPLEVALSRLSSVSPASGRMQPIILPSGAVVLRDDYKSTIESIDTALEVLAEIPARRIAVMGDVSEPQGNQRSIYRALGERIGRIASLVVIVGHRQSMRAYLSGALHSGLPGHP